MSRSSELMEAYEDARFAVLMDAVAQAEGQWALEENQRLKEDPEAAVPDGLRKQCEGHIRKAFSGKKRKPSAGALRRGLTIAAVVVLLLAATMVVTFAGIPSLRANVINTFRDVQEDHTEFSFLPESTNPETTGLTIDVGWLPEGFEQTEEVYMHSRSYKTFEKGTDARITILKQIPSESSMSVDTEDSKMTDVKIQGYDATLIEKNGMDDVHILWLDTDQNIVYLVYAEGIDTETALKIAESVS